MVCLGEKSSHARPPALAGLSPWTCCIAPPYEGHDVLSRVHATDELPATGGSSSHWKSHAGKHRKVGASSLDLRSRQAIRVRRAQRAGPLRLCYALPLANALLGRAMGSRGRMSPAPNEPPGLGRTGRWRVPYRDAIPVFRHRGNRTMGRESGTRVVSSFSASHALPDRPGTKRGFLRVDHVSKVVFKGPDGSDPERQTDQPPNSLYIIRTIRIPQETLRAGVASEKKKNRSCGGTAQRSTLCPEMVDGRSGIFV
jgi:hypothetical protein